VLAGESDASDELTLRFRSRDDLPRPAAGRFPTRELFVADLFADPTTLLADADDRSSQ
jgi:hypothetical protein